MLTMSTGRFQDRKEVQPCISPASILWEDINKDIHPFDQLPAGTSHLEGVRNMPPRAAEPSSCGVCFPLCTLTTSCPHTCQGWSLPYCAFCWRSLVLCPLAWQQKIQARSLCPVRQSRSLHPLPACESSVQCFLIGSSKDLPESWRSFKDCQHCFTLLLVNQHTCFAHSLSVEAHSAFRKALICVKCWS